jgi:dihydropteroate synthase
MAKLSDFSIKSTLNCKGRLLSLEQPVVMGILNITPDSFFDGGTLHSSAAAMQRAGEMISGGASILDIGGYSTRPGARDVPVREELTRIIPVIEGIAKNFPDCFISVDTFRAQVAREAIMAGAHIINDVSGGDDDPLMFETVASFKVPYILMHKKGHINTMQQNPEYTNVVEEVMDSFHPKIHLLKQLGVSDVVLDPGFGFGKTIEHNFELLNRLDEFHIFGLPVLAGLSRKSTVYRTLGITAKEALNGTTVLHTIALLKGAQILRAHDVKEAMECITLTSKLNG